MASKRIKSIKGRRMRLTRLDECGAPDTASTCGVIVTDGFVSVTISNEIEAGEEYTQKNAWGDFCIAEKDGDRVKWANVTIQMCEVDPEVLDLVGGANPVVAGGSTIGATFGTEPNPNAFAVEVWTKKAGTDACASGGTDPEWGYFVVPYVRNGKLDGDLTIENAPLTISLAGEGVGANSAWGVGPHGDAPMKATSGFPAGDLYGMVVTDVQPPNVTDGCDKIGGNPASASPGDTFGGTAFASITGSDATNAALLAGLGFTAVPSTEWVGDQYITVNTQQFYWAGPTDTWKPGSALRRHAGPVPSSTVTRTFAADPQITAADAPNAAKLTLEGFKADPQTAWTTGQSILIGTFAFNWTSSAWASGAHA